MKAEEDFWMRVWIGDGCWLWANRPRPVYGYTRWNGREVPAHRLAWWFANGRGGLPEVVRHRCDNPMCVRPDHLEAGSTLDNVRDRVERGRSAHKLSREQVEQIRVRYSGGERPAHIAADLGISRAHISRIARMKTRLQ